MQTRRHQHALAENLQRHYRQVAERMRKEALQSPGVNSEEAMTARAMTVCHDRIERAEALGNDSHADFLESVLEALHDIAEKEAELLEWWNDEE